MSVSEGLDEFRESFPACRLVAFIDLDARMVLSVSSEEKKRQEALDDLAESASQLLPISDDALSCALSLDGEAAPPDFAVRFTETGTVAFVRSSTERHEALCCSFAADVAVDEVLASARSALAELVSPG